MNNRLGSIHQHFNSVEEVKNASPCILILSSSDYENRAAVRTFKASGFELAWIQLHDWVVNQQKANRLSLFHLRVDFVSRIEQIKWVELKGLLAGIKRNYFSRGIALDPLFKHCFVWGEINGNALFYPAGDGEFSALNEGNFHNYARKKYGKSFKLNHADNQPIWLFDTEAVYCGEDGVVHRLASNSGPATGARILPNLDAEMCADLVTQSSEFLARQVKDNGMFLYGLFPCFNREIPTYNTLRHASSTYAMLEAWELTRSDFLKASIDRSLQCLTTQLVKRMTLAGGIQVAFLVDTDNEIKLGGNAVTILALAKYTELTGSADYIELMELLAQGIVAMLNPHTKQFVHVLNYPELSVKAQFRIIYYDGEAAFALMRLYKITRRAQWLKAVELAFDYFIAAKHWKANDHWLSYCVNELTQYRPKREYFEFGIRNFANHLDFVLTRITTFPTLLELMMAAEQMLSRLKSMPEFADLYAQVDTAKFYRAMHWRANYLLTGFFWPEWAMYFAKPNTILGSFFIRHHAYRVRIDDVEHYLSGLVAYRKFLDSSSKTNSKPGAHQGRSACNLNTTFSDATIWCLNRDMGFQRTGVENSFLLRNQLFLNHLGVEVVILTADYNTTLHDSVDQLKSEKSLSTSQTCFSIYDFLQESKDFERIKDTGENLVKNKDGFLFQNIPGSQDFKIRSLNGRLLMYVARSANDQRLIYVNHFSHSRKFRRDRYDSRGFLSSVQYLQRETGAVLSEEYLRPDGTTAILKVFTAREGKSPLVEIKVYNREGSLVANFDEKQSLVQYALSRILQQQGGKQVLMIDKNRLFYKQSVFVRDELNHENPNSVAVIPIIHALHANDPKNLHDSAENKNYVDILNDLDYADAIVVLTDTQKRAILDRHGLGRVFSIGHSYTSAVSRNLFKNRNRFRIVCMARYSPEKNQQLAIAAFAKVHQKFPDAILDFYGSGGTTNQILANLKDLVTTLGLDSSVRLHGWCDKPSEVYESAGLSILTSQGEAFSLAILESLHHGCPPLAFEVPYGPMQLVQDGVTGYLVPFGDIEQLATRILEVFTNVDLHSSLSENARISALNYEPQNLVSKWLHLFGSIGVSSNVLVQQSKEVGELA